MQEFWDFLVKYPPVFAALITITFTMTWQIVTKVLAAKPRVRWGDTNHNHFLVPYTPPATEENPTPQAATNSFRTLNTWFVNGGNAVAEDVEIVFNWKPAHMERFPHLPIKEETTFDNRYVVTIPRLNPKEGVSFSLLSLNQELPAITTVRCKGHAARRIQFVPQQQLPRWAQALIMVIMLLGIFAAVYLTVLLVFWLTPL